MNISYLEIGLKSSIFGLSYQLHSSSAYCARVLFKLSKYPSIEVLNSKSLSLQWKKFFGFRFQFFCEWCHKWGRFLAILAHVTWRRAQLLDGSISLKCLLETRLEYELFEPLINFLAFLVQQLWFKINRVTNHLISRLIANFLVFRS